MFAAFYARFSYSYFVVLFIIDRTYITSLVDIIIIACVLGISSSFDVARELSQNRQNEIFSSDCSSFNKELRKVHLYLLCSLIFNVLMLILLLWIFSSLESLFLFLLAYKYLENFLSGLIRLYEVREHIQSSFEDPSDNFHVKFIIKGLALLLEISYFVAIAFNKEISVNNFGVTIYLGGYSASVISKTWKLYKKIHKQRQIRSKLFSM